MKYAYFTPLPRTEEDQIKQKKRQCDIQAIAEKNNLVKLKCDYFGMNSYYYDKNTKTMYKVSNIKTSYNFSPNFEACFDSHILKINNITHGF